MRSDLYALGVSLASHLVNLACLYAHLSGFSPAAGLSAPLGCAGYAMGFVFWVVSPTPQGIGVVEGVMALVYTSLGVPAATGGPGRPGISAASPSGCRC